MSSAGVSPVASVLRETPRRLWISLLRSPFDSKKDILRSVGASRIVSSCKNLDPWSRRAERSGAVEGEAAFGDGLEGWLDVASLWGSCHCGMEGFFCSGSDILELIERGRGRESRFQRRDIPHYRVQSAPMEMSGTST